MAYVTDIPKEGKDPTLCARHCPKSLLNLDVKILEKLLASRLQHFLPSLIHLDQTRFIMSREARDNSIRAVYLAYWLSAQSANPPSLLLSTDAKKEFHRVD